ncbi:MAG: TonB-dependent receptor [Saprospirales bacterium]|nr:TonB-dependent receptor [Saprospirales bacterium]
MRLFAKSICLLLAALFVLHTPTLLNAQIPQGNRGNGQMNPAQMNIGRFYGKVVDEATGKGLGYASVQLTTMRFDTVSRSMQEKVVAGQLTEENGDFSLENLPLMGQYVLKISYMGYAASEQKVAFGAGGGRSNGATGGFNLNNVDKDLGNISLAASSRVLKEVTVTSEGSTVSLALDKKVYKVDKDGVAAGGNAEDALKNVPSVTVDIDGNVTLRNAAPQIFVDGRPTTLSLDQIPADVIDNIEIITNPSAKYDASGGTAGIVNIVLKKERRIGYNGSLRAGIDMRGKLNFGGDINARQGKINAFLSAGINDRRTLGTGETDRYNLFGAPLTNVFQSSQTRNDRIFQFLRGGVDWFINNRNTLTFTGNYHGGRFNSLDELDIRTDTLTSAGVSSSLALRTSESARQFRNAGSQLLYKHIYPKDGMEWTADLNLNRSRWDNSGDFQTEYQATGLITRQRQNGEGANDQITFQTDFVNPLTASMKVELGARAAIRLFSSDNASYQYDVPTETYIRAPSFADQYEFDDQVYAAYSTFSHSFKKWGYQAGLRAESSYYTGTLIDVDSTFSNQYPLSLFPSLFLTYKLNEEDNLQASYSRRINRPNFFQLNPFPDFSDSLLLSRGNPGLIPEFTSLYELSYQNIFNRAHNVLATIYYKRAVNLITSYQFTEYNALLGRDVIVSTYVNSNSSTAYGLEVTFKNKFWDKLELTSNLNFDNSEVNASNLESNLSREQFTWFIKENLNLKLPANLSFQASGSYQSRTAFALGGGSRWGGWGGGPSSSAQGYSIPVWVVDLSLRKDLWNRTGSITLSVQDIFRSRRNGSYSESDFFTQDSGAGATPNWCA